MRANSRDMRPVLALIAFSLAAACSSPAVRPAVTTPVTVALVAVGSFADATTIAVSGTVRLKRETPLAFNTSGRIAEIRVREGEQVGVGQVLARLDSTGTNAANAAARAEVARADAELVRLGKLATDGWITRSRLESTEAANAAARARAEQTAFDVRFAHIAAPTAGVILRRQMEPGQMITAGQPVLVLGEYASGFVLRIPLTDKQLIALHIGAPANVFLPALSPAPIVASVSEIAARADERTGTFQVELRLPAQPGLRSGLIGEAHIATSTQDWQLAVPATAVFAARADEGFVYVYDRQTARVKARLIGLGPISDHAITVTYGLAAGEQVVRSGADRLRDGMKVRIGA